MVSVEFKEKRSLDEGLAGCRSPCKEQSGAAVLYVVGDIIRVDHNAG